MLQIEPALPGATVDIVGNTITIRGTTTGRTTYRVTVDGTIQDIFGQTLGKDTTPDLQGGLGRAGPVRAGGDAGHPGPGLRQACLDRLCHQLRPPEGARLPGPTVGLASLSGAICASTIA